MGNKCIKKRDYLSVERTVCVKGILAVAVLFHHLYQNGGAFKSSSIDTLLASLKMWIVCFALLAAAFAATFMLMLTFYQTGASVIIKGLNSVVFVMCAAVALMRLPVACGVTRFLGSISLEIYVTQGMFLELFRCERLYVCSILLYTVLVIAATVVSSLMLHPLFRRIYSIWT